MKTHFTAYKVFLMLLGLVVTVNSSAQEIDLSNYRIRFNFKTIKQADSTRILESSFIAANKKDRKDRLPVYGAEVTFLNFSEQEEIVLGKAKTSKEGIAQLKLPKEQAYLIDEQGNIQLKAVFEGSDEMDMEVEEMSIQDVYMTLDLMEKDSIKTAVVKAHTIDSLGIKKGLDGVDVIISVKGMLSKMAIDEGTIEDGTYEFEMPNDLPGDVNSDIMVYATIEDHDDFGDVIQENSVNWGIFNEKQNEAETNTLWSDVAPIWMYVVLTILLVGIWANFVYTIINLIKIKKEGKELELKSKIQ